MSGAASRAARSSTAGMPGCGTIDAAERTPNIANALTLLPAANLTHARQKQG